MSTNNTISSSYPEIASPHSTEIVEITTDHQPNDSTNSTTAAASTSKKTTKSTLNFLVAKGRPSKVETIIPHNKADGDSTTTVAAAAAAADNPKLNLKDLQLYKSRMIESSEAFLYLKARVDVLTPGLKFCLFCFSMFPENAVIKRRLMTYWWIGESFVSPYLTNGRIEEQLANKFFDILLAEEFIVPVHEKRRPVADRCRMHPFVRLAVITLAEKAGFFDFDGEGNPTAATPPKSNRLCLAGQGLKISPNLDNLWTFFNCNECHLFFKPERFFRMKFLKVLYLGRWQLASAVHHIEVIDTKFLSGLKHMKHLRFFSLQGVSGIKMLPHDSFSRQHNLLILDLRACQHLEVIPENIGILQTLTHLDISGCYFVEHMPKSLCHLLELQVLKGFIVKHDLDGRSSCTLEDLAGLPKLRKLSIFSFLTDFPTAEHLKVFQKFTALEKLTIEWGEDPQPSHPDTITDFCLWIRFPVKLIKLDLVCLPSRTTPHWLKPVHLPGLKKLYIRGAAILDLQAMGESEFFSEDKWEVVEVVRLKYMTNLGMDWREFRELFPNLIYLEKFKCPKLAFFPCDEEGVWVNKSKLSESST